MPRKVEDKEKKAADILRLIAEEGYSLRKAAKENDMAAGTFILWASEDKKLAEQYARAREERGFALAEQTLEIADDKGLDPADKRVRIDARKWFASKLNPKKLGDKLDLNHGGQDGKPIEVINLMTVKPKTEKS